MTKEKYTVSGEAIPSDLIYSITKDEYFYAPDTHTFTLTEAGKYRRITFPEIVSLFRKYGDRE